MWPTPDQPTSDVHRFVEVITINLCAESTTLSSIGFVA